MSAQSMIAALLKSRSAGADPIDQPPRIHEFQVRSDRMRERAAEFAKLVVGLCPVPDEHEALIRGIAGVVYRAEDALRDHLEAGWPEGQSPITVPRNFPVPNLPLEHLLREPAGDGPGDEA